MRKATKIWLITAVVLVFIGLAVFAGAMTTVNWDFSKLSNAKYETNTFKITDGFENLFIEAKTDDIIFKPSDDNTCKVVCYEQEKMKHTAGVADKALEIKVTDTREWYEHIGMFWFDSPKTTVYLPQKTYSSLSINTDTGNIEIPSDFTFNSIDVTGSTGNVKCSASAKNSTNIKLSTGNISIGGVSSGKINLTASTGCIHVESVTCKDDISINVSTGEVLLRDINSKRLTSDGSTGNIILDNVIVSQSVSLKRSTGNVTLDGCDAGELFMKTSTGNITGSLLSEKIFITDTSTGQISVPKTTKGGKCEITTTTGNIKIEIN